MRSCSGSNRASRDRCHAPVEGGADQLEEAAQRPILVVRGRRRRSSVRGGPRARGGSASRRTAGKLAAIRGHVKNGTRTRPQGSAATRTTGSDHRTVRVAGDRCTRVPVELVQGQPLANAAGDSLKTSTAAPPRGTRRVGSSQARRQAPQPAILNFFDYQAADFQVSGRVTAMAVDPSCTTSSCRLWIAAAGGGIWVNDNGLAATPTWTFQLGRLRHERDRDARRTTRSRTRSTPGPANRTPRATLSPAWASTHRRTAATAGTCFPAARRRWPLDRSPPSSRSEPPRHAVRRHDTRRPRRVLRHGGLRVARSGRRPVGPLEDDRRRTELLVRLGRQRISPRRERTWSSTATARSTRGLPAGDLALDERRLHLGAGLRDAGSGSEHRADRVRR